ncbi:MAG TPA: Fic family protein [Chloroflexota bacterium]|nr:Fic family protein [Chloroflexota bacterium]
MTVRYLDTDEVISIALQAIISTGDRPQGFRDRGLLESAVMRPRFLAHYLDADLYLQAAALGLGISRSQAFVDGNKRAGYAAMRVFLLINGVALTAEPLELAHELEARAEAGTDPDQADQTLAAWLREHTAPA